VIIIGAGASGVGCGIILRSLGIESLEMRFITPSFTSNAFGLLDLNAVVPNSSPAHQYRREHVSGQQYALYLKALAEHFELPVRTGVGVESMRPAGDDEGGFILETSGGPIGARFVIWAGGEFFYPRLDGFPGAELCRHNATVRTWAEIPGKETIVVGGYESGVDAAVQLAALGKRVTVLDRSATWDEKDPDPSRSLSPFTHERLSKASADGRVALVGDAEVISVERLRRGFSVLAKDGRRWESRNSPILASGFRGSLSLVDDLFARRDDGYPLLTEHDESTVAPGLFLAGPAIRHDSLVFCFIYKFRQRFAVVAAAIAGRLGVDPGPLEVLRAHGMFLDDLSCCDAECDC
jgi:thioredoxin reductase